MIPQETVQKILDSAQVDEVIGDFVSLRYLTRETDHKVAFTPPDWAYDFPDDEAMNHKPHECLLKPHTNFYWVELGGEADTIADAEKLRDELLKMTDRCGGNRPARTDCPKADMEARSHQPRFAFRTRIFPANLRVL